MTKHVLCSHSSLMRRPGASSLTLVPANLFQPVRKLVSKSRQGARSRRIYDQALTPYQRMVASGALRGARQAVLERLYLSSTRSS
jgi:hypothetical protein